ISMRSLEERTLKFSLYDVDRHKKHNVIGHVLYHLRDLELAKDGRTIFKRDLEKEVNEVHSVVKVTMSHQNKPVKTKKTGVVKRSRDPAYNESFSFKLEADKLSTTSIAVVVMKYEPPPKADKLIGRVVLGSYMFARGKELEHWNEMTANQKEQIQQSHALTT
ncbi:PREDICTED: synaptotagmin-15-like, partial [Priapulus caudatus]|uniref:Synaptotagmin-15-like n=1 Tax=Priapulus caudatus TaxID=37621 RepID=A0ABM1F497_PRICU